ncbi:MAG: hypothetical protein GF317_00250 [Candidatus Lokiarchaeota archaeon]|nr:hypothetical protein [Candidatus Lokiarchaeota archaeon]MBD3198413.1 hypothetical protein [Candidatus Lokiarchaeota archaeon]
MKIENLIEKQLKIIKEILNLVESSDKFEKEEKEKSAELLKQIEEYFESIITNFRLVLKGKKMNILTCHNYYQWSRDVFIAFVKNIKNKWNSNLESLRLQLLDLFIKVREILVNQHNEQVPEDHPEERIEHYNRNKNKIETLIDDYYPFELYNLLKIQLNNIDEAKLNRIELESLFDIRGVLEARFGDINKAIDIYEDAYDKIPDSFFFNYNLALLLEKKGDIEKAFTHFSKVASKEKDPEILLIITRLYYLWDYYVEGIELIQKVLNMYYEVGTIDDHFLSIRGYPTYRETIANLAVFSNFLKKPEIAFNELEKAKRNFEDYPFQLLEPELNRFMFGNWNEEMEQLETELKQLRQQNSPLGENLTLQALIKARKANSYEQAIKFLDSVKLSSSDFPWLKDLISLGKAESADKFNKSIEEEKFQKEFLKEQPLLFEPYHVLLFGIDIYQEKLKKIYQKEQRSVDSGIKIRYFYKS